MPIILKAANKVPIYCATFLMLINIASAQEKSPMEVMISSGEKIVSEDRGVFISDTTTRRKIELPSHLKRALSTSSEIVFPEAVSRRLDGKDVFLIVVRVPSSTSPNGYCGAGSEDELYAVELNGIVGKIVFSKKVNSCLDNIDLSNDGINSSFESIKWVNNPVGISISWSKDQEGKESVRLYRRIKGGFKE